MHLELISVLHHLAEKNSLVANQVKHAVHNFSSSLSLSTEKSLMPLNNKNNKYFEIFALLEGLCIVYTLSQDASEREFSPAGPSHNTTEWP